jgi:predicted metal-dependent peptidase
MSTTKNNNSTAGKSPDLSTVMAEVSPEKMARFNIDHHLLALMMSEPFYADIVRSLTKVEDNTIPTAGVYQKDLELNLFWNRRFMASLENSQVIGVLKHEALHLALLHTTSRRYDPHWVANWSADLAINCMIPKDELPAFCLLPGRPFQPIPADKLAEYTPEEIERHKKLSALIASFPRDQSHEWYFGKLMDDPTIKEMEQERKMNAAAFNEALKRLNDAVNGQGDTHEGWGDGDGEVSEEDRQLFEGKVRQILKEAQQKADRNGNTGWGTIPAAMQEWIRKIVSGEVPWQSILRQFVGYTHRQDRMETWTRASKKDPLGQPGTTWSYRPMIYVYVDQSGSVPDSSLELFFGELASLSRKATFHVYYFDTEVDVKNGFLWRKGSQVKPQRTRCGGTDFNAPTRHANSTKECDAYIILTDGGAPKPDTGKKRRCWVIDPGNKLYFDNPDSRDVIVQMKNKGK